MHIATPHTTALTSHDVGSGCGPFFHIYSQSRIAGSRIAGRSAAINRKITSILTDIYSLTHCLISAHNLVRDSLDVASICCLEPKINSNQSVS